MLTGHENRVTGPSPNTAAHEKNSVPGMLPVETAAALSLIDVARQKIELARSLGYGHILIYMTAAEKDAALDQDAFAALKDEGYRVFPGSTPDFTMFDRGDPACEVVLIKWDRPPLPAWATATKSTPSARRAKSQVREKAAATSIRSDKSSSRKKPSKRAAAKIAADAESDENDADQRGGGEDRVPKVRCQQAEGADLDHHDGRARKEADETEEEADGTIRTRRRG